MFCISVTDKIPFSKVCESVLTSSKIFYVEGINFNANALDLRTDNVSVSESTSYITSVTLVLFSTIYLGIYNF